MRHLVCFCLLLIATALVRLQAAPLPKPKDAKPAIIDAGNEKNMAGVLACLGPHSIAQHRALIYNKEVAKLEIVRRQKDARAWLGENLRVEQVEGRNLVQVSLRAGTPKEQAIIVNAVVDQYLEQIGRKRDSLTKSLEQSKHAVASHAALRTAQGISLTVEQMAQAEEHFKKCEECIRALPALDQHAKTR